jgi:hypothetical protein
MTPASLYEVIAELAGIVADTNRNIRRLAQLDGYDTTAKSAATTMEKAKVLQHLLEGEAGLVEASVMVDPFA